MAFGQSKYYIDNLSENIKRGYREKLRKGLYPSFAPLGFLNNRQTRGIDPDPAKAGFIRLAFKLYAGANHSLDLIASILEKQGFTSYKGAVVSTSCLHRLLKNPIYYGAIRFNKQIYQGVHQPIITKKLFDQVQTVFQARTNVRQKRLTHNYPFMGFMKCGQCGCSITAEKQKDYIYYHCTKKKSSLSPKIPSPTRPN